MDKKVAVLSARHQLDLVELMLAGPTTNTDEEVEENVQKLQRWFQTLQENLRLRQEHPLTAVVNGKLKFVPQLFLILRECLLTHRFTEVSYCLEALLKNSVSCRHTLDHVGSALLQSGYENDEMLQQLVNQVKVLRHIDDRKVVLEFVLYLLAKGNTQHGKDFLYVLKRRTGYDDATTRQTMILVKAYTGLVWYVEWLLSSQRIEIMIQEKDKHLDSQGYLTVPIDGEQLQNAEAALESQRTTALECLSFLAEEEGLWDIFIKKCVQLHESKSELDKAKQVLEDYAKNNPTNPQALLYIYEYHVRHQHPMCDQLVALEKYCDAVPSDALVVTLYDNLISQGAKSDHTLGLLFDLLDFACWSRHVPFWQRLSKHLVQIVYSSDRDDHLVVKSCWDERFTWWPQYHFDELKVELDSEVDGLLIVKCQVAAVFLRDNLYLQTAMPKFLRYEESLKTIGRKAREIGLQ